MIELRLPTLAKPALYAIGGLVALLLVIWLGSKCTTDIGDYERERAAWDVERKQLQQQIRFRGAENAELIARIRADSAQAAPVLREVDTLLVTIERERAAKNRALSDLARRQRELADTTEMSRIAATAIAAAQAARLEADTLARAAMALRGIVSRQLQGIANLTGSLEATQARADSCAALLDRAPVYKGDKLLGLIPLPSRQTSLIVGAVAGVVTTAIVLRK